jgi:hypothetical protein
MIIFVSSNEGQKFFFSFLFLFVMEANCFHGTDTYGRSVQVGIRQDGVAFFRTYRYNGYGMGMTKWEMLNDYVHQPYKSSSAVYGEKTHIKWGFNELTGYANPRMRLPK